MALTGDISGSYRTSSVIGITGSIDLTYDGSGTEDGWIQLQELNTDPASPVANHGKMFIKDNGSGTTVPYFVDSNGTQTSMIAGANSTPAGSDSQVQYNNGGSMGGASSLVYNDSTHKLGIGTIYASTAPQNILSVYGNVSGDYVTLIDNDQSSAGHVLKLSTDGNGSGTRILEMEDGDGDILFRARADGRFGFGPDGVSSMGAGTFVVGIDNSSHTADIAISQRLQHLGDSNTYLDFPSNDNITFAAGGSEELKIASDAILVKQYIKHDGDEDTFIRFQSDDITVKAGNVSFINITEDDSQDKISFNEGRADVDFIVRSPNESLALYLNAGNEVFHINHGESAFKTKIHSTNGEAITVNSAGVILNEDGAAANDFRVESDNNAHMFFVDAGNEKIGIGTDSPDYELDVAGNIGVDEYIYHNGDDDTSIKFEDDVITLTAGAATSIQLRESSYDHILINSSMNDVDTYIYGQNMNRTLFKGIAQQNNEQVLILSGGSPASFDPADGTDVAFWVSGAMGSKGTDNRGASVFGGDMVVSGGVQVGAAPTESADGSLQDFIVNTKDSAGIIHVAGNHNYIQFQTSDSSGQLNPGPDTFFHVSGTINGKQNTGVAVFGGDVVTSGSVYIDKDLVEHDMASGTTIVQNTRKGSLHLTTNGTTSATPGSQIFMATISSSQVRGEDVIIATCESRGIFVSAHGITEGWGFYLTVMNNTGVEINNDTEIHINWVAL